MSKFKLKPALLIPAVLGLLGSCATINNTITGIQETIDAGETAMAEAAVETMDLEESMKTLTLFSQVYMAGGYMSADQNFDEGEGVSFTVKITSGGETKNAYTSSKALLKLTDEGSWWALSTYDSEQNVNDAEVLISEKNEIIRMRYRDEEGNIQEWTPEEGEDAETTGEGDNEDQGEADYSSFSQGWETINVPAGRFKAEKFMTEDDTEGSDTSQEWWITGDVPGEMVKYIFVDHGEDTTVQGELSEISKGHATQMESY